jgi:hypothetical protein
MENPMLILSTLLEKVRIGSLEPELKPPDSAERKVFSNYIIMHMEAMVHTRYNPGENAPAH